MLLAESSIVLTLTAMPTSIAYASESEVCDPDDAGAPDNDGDESCISKKNLGNRCDSDSNAKSDEGIYCGNPIDMTTGGKYEEEIDYVGSGPFPLKIVRYYNLWAKADTDNFHYNSNWSFSHARSIQKNNGVQALRGDQKTLTFQLINSTYTSEADVNSTLTKTTAGWNYVTGNNDVESYDSNGNLLTITNRAGLTQTYSYDTKGNIASITDPFGNKLIFTYTNVCKATNSCIDLLNTATDPSGGVYTYTYNTQYNITSVTYPDKTSKTYLYENTDFPHALTGIIDEKGVRFASWSYNTDGTAYSSEHAGGVEKVTIVYDFGNNNSKPTDALGRTTSYTYANILGVSRTADVVRADNSTSHRTYDANGNVTSYTDFNGNKTTYVYDTTRNIETSRTEAVGTTQARTIKTQWHTKFRLPVKITEANRVIDYTYDLKGNLTQQTITPTTGLARKWKYTYNKFSQLSQIDGPLTGNSDVTNYIYDTKGNLTSITNALGHKTSITSYDASGRPLKIVDPNGLVILLTYDARGLLLSRNVGGETTQYVYDPIGQVNKITQPDGAYLTFGYDDAHRLISVTDHLGDSIVYTLDAIGNRIVEDVYDPSKALSLTRSREFDSLNRLLFSIGADNQTSLYGYDKNDNLVSVTDPILRKTTINYDALNRLITSTDPNLNKTQYAYNVNDNLTQITDANGLATTYDVSNLGDVTKLTSPDTGTTNNTYDAVGNLLSSKDARGNLTQYHYDLINRVTEIDYADNTKANFSYDVGSNSIGRLSKATDVTGSTAWTYDNHGRVTSKTQLIGTVSLLTKYSYDTVGRLSTITYPSNKTLTLSYDKNYLTTINQGTLPLLSAIKYTAFGVVQGWKWGNNINYQRSFDSDGRISSYPLGNNTVTLNYDDAGQITNYSSPSAELSQQFIYDALGRLTDVNATEKQSLNYDEIGNRIALKKGSKTFNYSYELGNNHLSKVSNKADGTYNYDATGNTLKDGVNQFTYDARGRLVKTTSTANNVSYAINGSGQRVSKTVGATQKLFAYDEAGHLIGEYDNKGVAIQETVYLGDTPVAVLMPAANYFVYTDHLNTPRMITDKSNTVIWKWISEPFGTTSANSDPDGNGVKFTYNLRFPGQYFDAETGLHYNYFRDYNPSTGRYAQSDPIGLAGGINTYGYVGGNPVNDIDPLGLYVGIDDAIATGGGALVGIASQGISDIILGHLSGWEDYTSSAIGGAVGGEAFLYSGPIGAGLAGSAAHNLANQALKNISGKQCGFDTADFATETAIGGALGAGGQILRNEAGPLKQWIRIGRSYSKNLGQDISMSIRWGASPANGGKYLNQIPNSYFRNLNQWLRGKAIPGFGWRSDDAGHFHLRR